MDPWGEWILIYITEERMAMAEYDRRWAFQFLMSLKPGSSTGMNWNNSNNNNRGDDPNKGDISHNDVAISYSVDDEAMEDVETVRNSIIVTVEFFFFCK